MSLVLIEQSDLDAIANQHAEMTALLTGLKVQQPTANLASVVKPVIAPLTPTRDDRVMSTNQDEAGPSKRPIPWGLQCLQLDPEFINGLLWIESQIGLKPENLVPCMKFESNLNPHSRNPQSSASGLIQFMTGTARNLGTTIEAIRAMNAMQQLSYVFKYFKSIRQDWSDLDIEDTYMAILWPAGIGKPDDYVLFPAASESYRVNAGLDHDHDHQVTKAEACARIIKLQDEGFAAGNVAYV